MGTVEEDVEECTATLQEPEALIAFEEVAWPTFRAIKAPESADAFGDLVHEVDRGRPSTNSEGGGGEPLSRRVRES